MEQKIYDFQDPIEFLKFRLESRKLRNPRYSLRAFSRKLEFKNPAFLSQILTGKRKLKMNLARKIAAELELDRQERRFFESLVQLSNAKTIEEKSNLQDVLEGLRPIDTVPSTKLSMDAFKFVSDWYHVVILEVINLSSFSGEVGQIYSKLGTHVSRSYVDKAIDRLIRLGLVRRNLDGSLARESKQAYVLDGDVPNEAIRHFHKQMIQKGMEAVESQSTDRRDLRSTTISIATQDYAKAKELIAEFHLKMRQLSSRPNRTSVYQINTQFFSPVYKDMEES